MKLRLRVLLCISPCVVAMSLVTSCSQDEVDDLNKNINDLSQDLNDLQPTIDSLVDNLNSALDELEQSLNS